jgi:tRNA nucleotidyltransferase (CCA-adding enzyme)
MEAGLARRGLRPSQVRRMLGDLDPIAVECGWIAAESRGARVQIERYMRDYRQVRPLIRGKDLRSLGLEPGPIYRWILASVLDARLDGGVRTLDDELSLVQRLLDSGEAPLRRTGITGSADGA